MIAFVTLMTLSLAGAILGLVVGFQAIKTAT